MLRRRKTTEAPAFAFTPPPSPRRARRGRIRRRRIRWARVALVLVLLTLLSVVAGFFGFMTAIAQDLPRLEQFSRAQPAQFGYIYARDGRGGWTTLATLRSAESRVLVNGRQISGSMKDAIVAIEDRRFYEHRGVDPPAVARAVLRHVASDSSEGASTITQQFIKNAYVGSERSLRRKVREAALAYQLERRWGKDRILAEYLNTIYFGHGSYGVETAARYYFGKRASALGPAEAALLAALPKSPTEYDPVAHPDAARERRDLVLTAMVEQRLLSEEEGEAARQQPLLPPGRRPTRPGRPAREPYFVDHVTEQLVNQFGTARTFGGGLRVYTSLDLREQALARRTVRRALRGRGPQGALVSIDPRTGQVRAMISGAEDYRRSQFNIATHGRRQPGSAFKPFVLVAALRQGIRPETEFVSRPQLFTLANGDTWSVANNENVSAGRIDLDKATAISDNTVYAQLTMTVGPSRVADAARRLGVTSPIDPVPSIGLGVVGVTPLEMAQAYATLANRGVRIGGSLRVRPRAALLDPSVDPISIVEVHVPRANRVEKVVNRARHVRVVGESDALAAVDAMRGVVRYGTGKRASLGRRAAVGKTGTTSDYRDAWFVGMTPQRATSVWVGYPEVARQMETEFNGEPVTGGTFPALIWRAFMRRALQGQPALDWPSAPGVYAVPVSIDARTGRRAASDCPFARVLVLAADRIPDAQSSCPEDLAPVPDLTGMSAARATAAARDAGFRLRLSTRPARAGEDAGAVVVQAPQPLQSAVPGSVVTAEIAVEVPHAVVPRVAGGAAGVSTVARAAARLTAARFRVVLDDEQVAAQPSGTVIGQAPAGGSEAPLGSVVRLLVVGRADGVALAELRGLSLSRARATLARSGVSVVARRVGGRSRPDDVVISTEPERGSVLPRGGSVSLLTAPRSPSAGR